MPDVSSSKIQEVLKKHYKHVVVTRISTELEFAQLVARKPDLVFMGMKRLSVVTTNGLSNEFAWVSQLLDDAGIKYTGSSSNAIALDFDKSAAKDVARQSGLKTSSYFIAEVGQYQSEQKLPLRLPLFIKPLSLGDGAGIESDSVIRTFTEYTAKVQSLSDTLGSRSLVEEYLSDREFTVAILENPETNQLDVMPIEMLPATNNRGDKVIGYTMKSSSTETPVAAVEEGELKDSIMKLASGAFKAMGATGYGRIDIRLNDDLEPHFLEANLVPSLIEGSGNLPKACKINRGMTHEDIILRITELGFLHTQYFF